MNYIGEILTFFSIISGILICIYNESDTAKIAYIFAVAAQFSGCAAGIYMVIVKYNYKKKNSDYIRFIKNLEQEIEREEKEKEHLFENIHTSLSQIASSIKSNAIHNNSILVEIPDKGNEQYQRIEELFHSTYSEDIIISKTLDSLKTFGNEMVRIFNTYCRNSTDSLSKVLSSYFNIKGLTPEFSIAIELFDEPYFPTKGGMEELKAYTAFRDNKTYEKMKALSDSSRHRNIGEIKYSVSANSDFVHCLKYDSYIINNATEGDEGRTYERTRGYLDFYNCSMVVPVRIKNVNQTNIIYGYMCCDCMNDNFAINIFDMPAALFLFTYAQNLGTFLETLDTNWVDRTRELPVNSKNILELLDKKIYKGN